MAVMMVMEWPGATLEQYDEVRRITRFETEHPAGGIFHVAAIDGDVLRVVDVWESPQQFQAFVDAKLNPAAAEIGITTQPTVSIYPAHNVFNPGAK
jgi:hypothetical protein